MIGLTCAQGLLLYMVLCLAVIAVLYWRSSRRRLRNQWQHQSDGHLFSCDHCHYAFLNKDDVNLTRCPRCNSICIRRRNR